MSKELDLGDTIRETIAEILEVEVEDVQGTSGPGSLKGWDSLGHIQILFALEERFELDQNDEVLFDCRSVNEIVRVLTSLGRQPRALGPED